MKVILSCSLLCCSLLLQADPTQPELDLGDVPLSTAQVQADTAELRLSLIKTVQGQPVALINGKMVRPGDQIEHWKVSMIETQRVTLRQGTDTKILQLFKTMKTND